MIMPAFLTLVRSRLVHVALSVLLLGLGLTVSGNGAHDFLAAHMFSKLSPIATRAAIVEAASEFRVDIDPALSAREAGDLFHRIQSEAGGGNDHIRPADFGRWPLYDVDRAAPDESVIQQNEAAWAYYSDYAGKTIMSEGYPVVQRRVGPADGPNLLSEVVRADAVNLVEARYREAAYQDHPLDLAYPRFGPMKEMAYARAADIALAVAEGRFADGERVARELYTYGLLQERVATSLIEGLIGAMIGQIGLGGLELVYAEQLASAGPDGELEEKLHRLQAATNPENHEAVAGVADGGDRMDPEAMFDYITANPTLPHAVAWDHFRSAMLGHSCSSFPLVRLQSPEKAAMAQLIDSPGEERLFDLKIAATPAASLLDWPRTMGQCLRFYGGASRSW